MMCEAFYCYNYATHRDLRGVNYCDACHNKSFPMKIQEIQFHRNGVSGIGFHAIRFEFEGQNMLAMVFPESGAIGVLCIDDLPTVGVGRENKHRGDVFEPELRKAIHEYNEAL